MRDLRRTKGKWLLRNNKRLLNYNIVFMEHNNSLMKDNVRDYWIRRFFWFLFWHKALRRYLFECGRTERGLRKQYRALKEELDRYRVRIENFASGRFIWDQSIDGEKFWDTLYVLWDSRVPESVRRYEAKTWQQEWQDRKGIKVDE